MAPTVILIRHAEALHNLSELGEQQCRNLEGHLKAKLPLAEQVDLIVVSPLRRTLQTADIGLRWLIERGVKVLPDADWQENSDKPCDTGSDVSIMAKEFPHFDFSPVDPAFPDKTSPAGKRYAFTRMDVLGRGQRCLAALAQRPEKVIAVVSHSGFLRTSICGMQFANADYRIVDFTGNGTEIKEWETTREAGGGMGRCDKLPAPVEPGDFPEEAAVWGEATAEVPAKN